MIDLSFLTEEEQETIRAVLKRDAELKKAEEQRVQNLQRTATDRNRLRYLTGEWFYETKQRRHRDRIHGSDLIRASMRHTYRPLTIMELSHILPERSSFVSSENKEVFVPPVLCGLLQEPDRNLSCHRNRVLSPDESGLQSPKAAFRSPSKQRKNPFDWEDGRLKEEAPGAPETAPPSGSHVPPVTNLKQDFNDNSVSQDESVPNVQKPEGTQSRDLSGTVEVPQGSSRQASETWRGAEGGLKPPGARDQPPLEVETQRPSEGGPEEDRPTWKTEENPPGAEAGPRQSVGDLSEQGISGAAIPAAPGRIKCPRDSDSPLEAGHCPVGPVLFAYEAPREHKPVSCSLKSSSHLLSQKYKQKLLGLLRREKDSFPRGQSPQRKKLKLKPRGFRSETKGDPIPEVGSVRVSALQPGAEARQEEEEEEKEEEYHPKEEMDLNSVAGREEAEHGGGRSWSGSRLPPPEEVAGCKRFDDGTYRALPVFIYDETDDSLACLESPVPEQRPGSSSQVWIGEKRPLIEAGDPRSSGHHVETQESQRKNPKDGEDGAGWSLKDGEDGAGWSPKDGDERTGRSPKDKKDGAGWSPKEGDDGAGWSPKEKEDRAGWSAKDKNDETRWSPKDREDRAGWNPKDREDRARWSPKDGDDGTRWSPKDKNDGAGWSPKDGDDGARWSPKSKEDRAGWSPKDGDCRAGWSLEDKNDRDEWSPKDGEDGAGWSHKDKNDGDRWSPKQGEDRAGWSPKNKEDMAGWSPKDKEDRAGWSPKDKNDETRWSPKDGEDRAGWSSKDGDERAGWSPKDKNDGVGRSPKTKNDETRWSPKDGDDRAGWSPKNKEDRAGWSPKDGDERTGWSPKDKNDGVGWSPKDKNDRTRWIPKDGEDRARWSPKDKEDRAGWSPKNKNDETRWSPKDKDDGDRWSPKNKEDRAEWSPKLGDDGARWSPKDGDNGTRWSPQDRNDETGWSPIDGDCRTRWSPSKTYHPKVLPLEASGPKGPRLDGSPLKTFPIEIDQQQRDASPGPKQRSPSHRAKPKEAKPAPPLHRSVLPRDPQHYLGPAENAHSPPFDQERAPGGAGLVSHGNPPGQGPNKTRPRRAPSKEEEPVLGVEPGTRCRASSGYEERSSPVVSALRRLASRSKSSSKSLENLTAQTASPVSCSKLMKSCNSVPLLQQDETDGDGAFEDGLGRRRNNSSSVSNMTLSSGMASMSSVSSSSSSLCPPEAEGGGLQVQGSIQLALSYIHSLRELQLFVVLVRGLGGAPGRRGGADPYVKCYLLPDKRKLGKRKTSVKKRTLNPTYNEVLRFPVGREELRCLRLNASVWHHDPFGRNRFLGQMDLDLEHWDLSNTQIHEYPLTARESEPVAPPSGGRMRVALRFLSQSPGSSLMGELQIWVKDCKNLPAAKGDVINPFVKCTVLPDMSSRSRQKTRVVKRTCSPMFNHIMVYDGLRAQDLDQACVEVTVWDQDRLQNHYLGGVRLGPGTGRSYGVEVVWMDSGPGEAGLWQRMLQSDGGWVEEELPLRQLVTAKSMSK